MKTSDSSVGDLSRITGSTEQSYTTMSEESESDSLFASDIPLEVIIINDDEVNMSSTQGSAVSEDVEHRLKIYESTLESYRLKLKSTEDLNDSLHKYLRQTQGYAEDLMSEREELVNVIKDMEKDNTRRIDQDLLLKAVMCSGLFFYLFNGSHQFLVGAAVLQLIVTLVNIFV